MQRAKATHGSRMSQGLAGSFDTRVVTQTNMCYPSSSAWCDVCVCMCVCVCVSVCEGALTTLMRCIASWAPMTPWFLSGWVTSCGVTQAWASFVKPSCVTYRCELPEGPCQDGWPDAVRTRCYQDGWLDAVRTRCCQDGRLDALKGKQRDMLRHAVQASC